VPFWGSGDLTKALLVVFGPGVRLGLTRIMPPAEPPLQGYIQLRRVGRLFTHKRPRIY